LFKDGNFIFLHSRILTFTIRKDDSNNWVASFSSFSPILSIPKRVFSCFMFFKYLLLSSCYGTHQKNTLFSKWWTATFSWNYSQSSLTFFKRKIWIVPPNVNWGYNFPKLNKLKTISSKQISKFHDFSN